MWNKLNNEFWNDWNKIEMSYSAQHKTNSEQKIDVTVALKPGWEYYVYATVTSCGSLAFSQGMQQWRTYKKR